MSATHAQHVESRAPQRKPTGASDHLLAGAQYGLHAADVTEEPASFASGRIGPPPVSSPSTLSPPSSLDTSVPPPLPPKIPVEGDSPRYTVSRTGSVSVASVAPQRPAPSLSGSSQEPSPLTPPLTPHADPRYAHQLQAQQQQLPKSLHFPVPQPHGTHSRTSSGSRPLPKIPQPQPQTPPPRSPVTAAHSPRSPSSQRTQVSPRRPESQRPRTPLQQRSAPVDRHEAESPIRAALADAQQCEEQARLPQPINEPPRASTLNGPLAVASTSLPAAHVAPRSSSIAVHSKARLAQDRPTQSASSATGRAVVVEQTTRITTPQASHVPIRAATVAVQGGQPSDSKQAAPLRASTTDTKTALRPTATEIEYAQAAQVVVGAPPSVPAGPPPPEKQASSSSAPAQVTTTNNAASPHPPKPSTPTTSASVPAPRPDRPKAQPKDKVKVEGKETITHVSYLDPCLQKSLLTVPASVTTTTDAALSAVEAYPEQDFNWTIGAPIGGLGGLAKHYVLRPDAKFQTVDGGISVTLSVIDERGGGVPSPAPTPGPDGQPTKTKQGRTKARVEVRSDRGGILVDLKELDANRQIDLHIETRKGDVLLLLPDNFLGPVHVRGEEPKFGSILMPMLDKVVNPYEDLWTTNVVPLGNDRGSGRNGKNQFRAHKVMKGVSKYVPGVLRGQNDYLDMAVSSYTTLKKGDHSKVLIKSEKGKVCVGLRGSRDAADLKAKEGIKVGAQEGTRKHWWG